MPNSKLDPQSDIAKRGYCVDQVAMMYGVSRQKIYDEINAGRLYSFKIGQRRIIPTNALNDWEKGGTRESNDKPRSAGKRNAA